MHTPSVLVEVGKRIRHARALLSRTQEEVTVAMGFNDRQTLSDIETGKRAVKSDELMRFSDVLDQDVEFFIDPFSAVGEAKYSWRASLEVPEDVLNKFEARATGWIGMLRWLRAQSNENPRLMGAKLFLNKQSQYEDAQLDGEMVADKLKLGLVPARTLAESAEAGLSISVLFVDADSDMPYGSISGAACQLKGLGAVLVNRRESLGRRNFDLAHEIFHVLTWDTMEPEHRESNSTEAREASRRVERLADNFAAALLMPRTSLDQLIDPARQAIIGHLAEVAAHLQVTPIALGWRLKILNRIDEQTRIEFSRFRLPPSDAQVPKLFSLNFVQQLHVALDKGRLTARKASKSLGLSLAELHELFASYGLPDPLRS